MKKLLLILFLWLPTQILAQEMTFTRADSLRGALRPERTSFDVNYYHLDIKVDPDKQFIDGSNLVLFTVVEDTKRIQLDLYQELQIGKIEDSEGNPLRYTREYNAVFVDFPNVLKKGSLQEIKVYYHGYPKVAPRPPWDGGVSWGKDAEGNPWVVVTCQGTGASVWWPTKDYQGDEQDSMMVSITVPKGLKNISNGRLRNTVKVDEDWTRYDWFVDNPINNYNVTMNIGNYVHFGDTYDSVAGEPLTLDYWVMPYDLEKAKKQFQQVKPMMACFEKHFGAYPFIKDGYKLVQSPHPGMEHQSAVAYGNYFKNGYRMKTGAAVGTKFDFIIIHETAHEWFGNSLTSEDLADMWIHESFGAYLEAIYAECEFGYDEAMDYMLGKWQDVRFDRPTQGPYQVNTSGSGDMYPKGALMLNTLRHALGDDDLWFKTLKSLTETFKKQIVTYDDVTNHFSKETGKDLSAFFSQYIQHVNLPKLETTIRVKGASMTLDYRWIADVPEFDMPVKVTLEDGSMDYIYPTTRRQSIPIQLKKPRDFHAENTFFIDTKHSVVYEVE